MFDWTARKAFIPINSAAQNVHNWMMSDFIYKDTKDYFLVQGTSFAIPGPMQMHNKRKRCIYWSLKTSMKVHVQCAIYIH